MFTKRRARPAVHDERKYARPLASASLAAMALALCACGGGGSGGGGQTPPANTAPTVNGPVTSAATDNDAAYTISEAELVANASDADGDTLTVSGLSVTSGNTVGVTVNGSSVDVDPAAYDAFADGDTEVVVLGYTVGDGNGGTVAATAEITISGANDAPTRVALTNVLVAEGQPTAGGFEVGLLYADDPEQDGVTFAVAGGADAARFSVSGIALVLDDGVLAAASQDRYEVTLEATDGGGASATFDMTVLVYESPALTIGYYDIFSNAGGPEQITPITFIGETAADVGDMDTADLGGLDVLFVQNPSASAPAGPYAAEANLAKVAAFVEAGGVLVFHDRYVDGIEELLPGQPGNLVVDVGGTRVEFEIVESPTFVTLGPGGAIDGTTLESSTSLSFGYARSGSVPFGSVGYLSRNDPTAWISYSYPFGSGHVIYSSIPLDFYLRNGSPEVMRTIYAPNILAQARALRKKGDDLDGDGLLDVEEEPLGTMADAADSDGDTMDDLFEVRNGLDPNDAGDTGRDADGDGLTNLEEFTGGTLPGMADSDADGLPDGDELNVHGTDPRNVDTDGDALSDFDEVNVDGTDPTVADTDGGGSDDGREVLVDGTDPLDGADDLDQIDLPADLNDVSGYLWDVQRDGNINRGTTDAYDGGMRLFVDGVQFGEFARGSLTTGDREIRIGVSRMSGLDVSRRIYVPDDRAFARFVDVLDNPTDADIAVTVRLDTNLGSDGGTLVVSTSDGDPAVELTDNWAVTDDASDGGGDPTLSHVFAGPGAFVRPVPTVPLGSIIYTYNLTVPANGRAILMHFEAQNANRTVAVQNTLFVAGLGSGTLTGLTSDVLGDIVNFDLMQPAAVSQPAAKVVAPLCEVGPRCD